MYLMGGTISAKAQLQAGLGLAITAVHLAYKIKNIRLKTFNNNVDKTTYIHCYQLGEACETII